MSYITEIYERLDIQHIRSFLLHGTKCPEINSDDKQKRLKSAADIVIDKIHVNFPDKEENEDIMNDIYNYVGVTQDVYMEIGMQCGAAIAARLLTDPSTSPLYTP